MKPEMGFRNLRTTPASRPRGTGVLVTRSSGVRGPLPIDTPPPVTYPQLDRAAACRALLPEHVETRPLFSPTRSGTPAGARGAFLPCGRACRRSRLAVSLGRVHSGPTPEAGGGRNRNHRTPAAGSARRGTCHCPSPPPHPLAQQLSRPSPRRILDASPPQYSGHFVFRHDAQRRR